MHLAEIVLIHLELVVATCCYHLRRQVILANILCGFRRALCNLQVLWLSLDMVDIFSTIELFDAAGNESALNVAIFFIIHVIGLLLVVLVPGPCRLDYLRLDLHWSLTERLLFLLALVGYVAVRGF